MKTGSALNKPRILAVDDEVGFTRLLRLAASQYEIRTENDASHVIDAVKEFKPDLILMDRAMPHISGDQLAAEIKLDPNLGDIPVAFITAIVPHDETGRECTSLNGCPVLAKPVTIDAIDRCVKNCLKKE